ncbi:MAG: NAD-dependent 4,6-dehydratase LegB [Bacillota bacterium]
MSLRGKKVLVTGADGFIGSHLTEKLVHLGAGVTALAQYNSFNNWGWLDDLEPAVKKDVHVVTGDIREYDNMKLCMKGQEVVFHLAALIAIPYSYRSPAAYVRTNVEGTMNVMQAALDSGVEKVVHTSTSEVYGTARYVPIDENHPLQGQSPYSASKIGADKIVESFNLSYGLPVITVRPFNTYGPRQSARAVIPTIITQIACGKRRIKLGALHPTRDFNYVLDTVQGFIAAAGSDYCGEVVNIGSNFEVSIGETARLIAEVMGVQIEIETDEDRLRPAQSEVERLWADNQKAKALLGWEPDFAGREGFKKGIGCTVNWFTKKEILKKYKSDIYNI